MGCANIFTNIQKHEEFSWDKFGNIKEGREDLSEEMQVLVYRLMQYTMLDVLSKAHGLDQANEYFRKAGSLAGIEFAKNCLDLTVEFSKFVIGLQKAQRDLKVGILRMEKSNATDGSIILTVGQKLDCSGLPITNKNACIYDEGFIAGIFEAYTGKNMTSAKWTAGRTETGSAVSPELSWNNRRRQPVTKLEGDRNEICA